MEEVLLTILVVDMDQEVPVVMVHHSHHLAIIAADHLAILDIILEVEAAGEVTAEGVVLEAAEPPTLLTPPPKRYSTASQRPSSRRSWAAC